MTSTTTRNATLEDLAVLLKDQQGRKHDVVAPAQTIRAEAGQLVLAGDGRYTPTETCDAGIAAKLDIPVAYLRRTRQQRPDLYDYNVNAWLENDDRQFLVRALRDNADEGIARAFLSDSYAAIDNLDALVAALSGIRAADADAIVDTCDLSERRMYVRVQSQSVAALAPELMRGYRSPFTGDEGTDNPTVFAGFVLSNSEVGQGAFTITPRLVFQVCRNGMTISRDALRQTHLGSKLDAGVISWSDDTRSKNVELIGAQARDSVATFLDSGYVERQLLAIEGAAAVRISEPQKVISEVGKQLHFTDAQVDDVLSSFIAGGQLTAGGVMQAVTAAAQTTTDADTAFDMEASGIRALELAAQLSR